MRSGNWALTLLVATEPTLSRVTVGLCEQIALPPGPIRTPPEYAQDPRDYTKGIVDSKGQTVDERERTRVEPSAKRIRGYLHGELVFDTIRALLVWEVPYYPAYYIPIDDVSADLVPNGHTEASAARGTAEYFDIKVSTGVAEGGAWRYLDSPVQGLRDVVRFEWAALDQWLEEDEPVYTHARNPYTRVDILASSRHVEVVVAGVKVADSHKPTILFETGLPPRFYLPMSDVRMDLLRPSDTVSHCPYKGAASYWSLEVGGQTMEDFVWIYRTPLPESEKIAGLAAFYNEKVDLYVDGELQRRPRTKFSDSE